MARALFSEDGSGDDIGPPLSSTLTAAQQASLKKSNEVYLKSEFGIDVTAPGFDGGAAANTVALAQADRLRPSSGIARQLDWVVNNLFQVFVIAGTLGTYAAASGAAGSAATSGVDLAADAAIGTGNNITTAGAVFGSSDAVAEVTVETFSGVDLAADAVVGSGNNITTAAEVFGNGEQVVAPEVANYGSDAHLYQPGGPTLDGLSPLANTGGSVTPTLAWSAPAVDAASAPEIANTGSDAHFYQEGGPTLNGTSPLANTAGTFTPTLSWSAAADSIAGSVPAASTAPAASTLPSLQSLASGASTLAGLVKAGEQLYNAVVPPTNGNGGNPQSKPAGGAQARSLWPVLAIVGGLFFALKG